MDVARCCVVDVARWCVVDMARCCVVDMARCCVVDVARWWKIFSYSEVFGLNISYLCVRIP